MRPVVENLAVNDPLQSEVPIVGRKLRINGYDFPLLFRPCDLIAEIAQRLRKAVWNIGREPGGKRGAILPRMEIRFRMPLYQTATLLWLADRLPTQTPPPSEPVSEQ